MTDLREALIERAWDAMDNRNDVDVGLVDLAEAAVDALGVVELAEKAEALIGALSIGPLAAAAKYGPDFDLEQHIIDTADHVIVALSRVRGE
ncbi:MAG: hypothetical protein OEQ39_04425 [Gammaproteobacteria bacterium]|nr:hypothetical protein [Gammaproteobacteria bacterium]